MNTHLVVILDRSGSMEIMRADMQSGFDNFIAEQRKVEGTCVLTLVQFDSISIDTVLDRVTLDKVPPLALVPRGGTPLLDAIGKTVTKISSIRAEERTLVIIITDGWENASREWQLAGIKSLITERRSVGWEFMYLGANVDAFAEASAMGISVHTTSGYTAKSAKPMFDAVACSTTSYRSGLTAAIPDEVKKDLETE